MYINAFKATQKEKKNYLKKKEGKRKSPEKEEKSFLRDGDRESKETLFKAQWRERMKKDGEQLPGLTDQRARKEGKLPYKRSALAKENL